MGEESNFLFFFWLEMISNEEFPSSIFLQWISILSDI